MGAGVFLWLYQRHALKAFRASVGDKEGHYSFVPPKKLNSRCSQAVSFAFFFEIVVFNGPPVIIPPLETLSMNNSPLSSNVRKIHADKTIKNDHLIF